VGDLHPNSAPEGHNMLYICVKSAECKNRSTPTLHATISRGLRHTNCWKVLSINPQIFTISRLCKGFYSPQQNKWHHLPVAKTHRILSCFAKPSIGSVVPRHNLMKGTIPNTETAFSRYSHHNIKVIYVTKRHDAQLYWSINTALWSTKTSVYSVFTVKDVSFKKAD